MLNLKMKSKTWFIAPLLLTSASVYGDYYTGVGGAYLFDTEEFAYAAYVGYDFAGDNVSTLGAELEFSYLDFSESAMGATVDGEYLTCLVNFRGDSPVYENLSAYFSVGAGISQIDFDVPGTGSDDDIVLAAQGSLGLEYHFTENFSVTGGLRLVYFDSGSLNIGGAPQESESIDEFATEFGLRYRF